MNVKKVEKWWIDAVVPDHDLSSCKDNDPIWGAMVRESKPHCKRCYLLANIGRDYSSLCFQLDTITLESNQKADMSIKDEQRHIVIKIATEGCINE